MKIISSRQQLEQAALEAGVLPFFVNHIVGFSVQELAAPGMLFGEGADDYGCWEWKGPVIREMTTAYGKFFNRKAGFIALELFPDFINYRRAVCPVGKGTVDEAVLELLQSAEAMTSTELKRQVLGTFRREVPDDLEQAMRKPRRQSLEGPLQRLQMGGHVIIADFEYKHTAQGERYGFGVAVYTTPEALFGSHIADTDRTPEQSFDWLVAQVAARNAFATRPQIERLLK